MEEAGRIKGLVIVPITGLLFVLKKLLELPTHMSVVPKTSLGFFALMLYNLE